MKMQHIRLLQTFIILKQNTIITSLLLDEKNISLSNHWSFNKCQAYSINKNGN